MLSSILKDPSLFKEKCYLNGQWCDADNAETIDVVNPATGETLGSVPLMGGDETRKAIDAGQKAWPAWRAKTAKERSTILNNWYQLLMEHQEDLAVIMTAEQGKPLSESRGEIAYSASFIEWFAEECKRVYGDVIPETDNSQRLIVVKQPVGVCVAVTPWNFPSAMIARKAAPALAVGCPMVVKPAKATPFSALALAELGERAGIPKGIFSVITGSSSEIGKEMTSHPDVRKFTFTGSTEVGKHLTAECASTMKKVSMELGGNAPFIVFDDADIDAAVEGAIVSKYRNTGQTCVCANRFYVQSGVYREFSEKFVDAVEQLKVGNGLENDTDQGPLIDRDALEKVEEHVQDCLARGGKVATGGKIHQLGGTFYEPTIILEANANMKVAEEETFGPVAPLFRFDTEQDAIAMSNDTEVGLAAYIYTTDLARSWRVGAALEYGMIGINTGLISNAVAPFGGIKESGFGREGSKYGVDDYLEIKYMCVAGL